MLPSLLILFVLWVWVVDALVVGTKFVYLRSGRVICVKGASKMVIYIMLFGAIFNTGQFIYTYVLPL